MSCFFPFQVDNPAQGAGKPLKIPVPCGKCPYCLQRRANNWIFRCQEQTKVSKNVRFVTLTYANENLSKTKKGFKNLVKKDLQDFHKRLRHHNRIRGNLRNIKYFAVGEYGSLTHRPHYHGIYFNSLDQAFFDAWKYGRIDIQPASNATVAYVAKYINKGKTIPKFDGDDRQKEFQLFSKGLGINYLTEQTIKYHQDDPNRLFCYVDGYKKALPRYFKDKIFTTEQKLLQSDYAQKLANDKYDEQYKEYLESRSYNQSFEQFRYERKNEALKQFRRIGKERNKI